MNNDLLKFWIIGVSSEDGEFPISELLKST